MEGIKHCMSSAVIALVTLLPATMTYAQTQHCSGGNWDVGNGLTAECWYGDNYQGTACLTTYGDTGFKVEWNQPAYGFLHEVGRYDINLADTKIADMNSNAIATHSHQFGSVTGVGGYTGFYGWLLAPGQTWPSGSIEYYVIEDWSGSNSMPDVGTFKGTINVDGGTYNIYYARVQQWEQWWSIRTSKRTNGTIHYVQHFQAWKDAGMPEKYIGRLAFKFESLWGGASAGSITYSKFTIDIPTQPTATREIIPAYHGEFSSANVLKIPDGKTIMLRIFGLNGTLIESRTLAGHQQVDLRKHGAIVPGICTMVDGAGNGISGKSAPTGKLLK